MRRRDAKLWFREKRVAAEQVLLNRALRASKNRLDRAVTAVVMTKIPQLPAEPGRTKTVDDQVLSADASSKPSPRDSV